MPRRLFERGPLLAESNVFQTGLGGSAIQPRVTQSQGIAGSQGQRNVGRTESLTEPRMVGVKRTQ